MGEGVAFFHPVWVYCSQGGVYQPASIEVRLQ